MIAKQDAIDLLAKHRREGAVSVSTMQSAFPWHEKKLPLHLEAVGCMGSASTIGLGLALGAPERTVMVLDGDGSLLMQLGSLVTIASEGPANFYHFVFANGFYESSGNQRLPGNATTDLRALALAAGYAQAVRFETADELDRGLPGVYEWRGPVLIELAIARDDAKPRWAGILMNGMVRDLKRALGG